MKIHKSISLLLVLVAILVLGSCSGKKESTASAKDSITTIKIWTKDRHDQEFMTALIDKFNKENPDIHVVYEMYTDNYQQTIQIAASTGELPDILTPNPQAVTNNIISRDLFLPIEEYLTPEIRANFDNSLFVEGVNMHNGKIFSLPSTGTTLRLVYNKDIFKEAGLEAPPKSLAELVAYSKQITQKLGSKGVYGFALPLKNPISGFQRGFTQIPMLSGTPVMEGFDFAQGKYDFSGYKPVVQALTEIWKSGAAFPGCESLDIDPLRTQFAAGKIGMYMTYNHSEWGVYTKQFPTTQNWAYAPLPTNDGTIKGSQKLTAGTWYAMTKSCKDPAKGWRVLKAIYEIDGLADYYEKGLGVSVLPVVISKAKMPESISYTSFMGIQPTDKIWPLEPVAIVPEGDDWGRAFAAVIFGASSDLDTVIKELNVRYNAAYEKSVVAGSDKRIRYPNFKASDPAGTMK